MSVPRITGVQLSEPGAGPLLLLGPSLGTSVSALWAGCLGDLGARFHVVGWDLPGHGRNREVRDSFTLAELAAGVLALADGVLAERGEPGGSFCYAGVSAGGAVGLQLLLDDPARLRQAALICTGAKIGDPESWAERAARVRTSGTPVMVTSSAERWFGPGFLDRHPDVGAGLLHSLQDADREGYAQVCDALAGFDVRDRLGEITLGVLAIAGAEDPTTPPASLEQVVNAIPGSRLVVLDGVSHLAPAERPDEVSRVLLEHFTSATSPELVKGPQPASPEPVEGSQPTSPEPVEGAQPTSPELVEVLRQAQPTYAPNQTTSAVYDAGMVVRREVLGDAHVNRATNAATDFTREFQEFITSYAWGSIWTRPGLDRRSRSLITLTALVARGHHEELAMHVRAARTNGLTNDEIKELLLQTAIYCGVPDANTAFRIAQRVLAELDDPDGQAE